MWLVNVKGKAGEVFEISVVRRTNNHGRLSYGWFDEDKLLISSSGGPCNYTVTPKVWAKLLKVAKEVADELNQKELT